MYLPRALCDFPDQKPEVVLAKLPAEIREQRLLSAEIMSTLASWRMGMGIYRFDPTVAQSLIETPMTKLPTEALFRLPEWCVYIEAPPGLLPADTLGFFARLEYHTMTGRSALHLVYDKIDPNRVSPIYLFLDQPTLEDCLLATLVDADAKTLSGASAKDREFARAVARGGRTYALPACLNLILYLCADEADFGGAPRPRNPEPVKTKKGMKLFPASNPRYWSVGRTLGEKLREAARVRSATPGERSGPSPHLRRAHWHSYWVGKKGQQEIRVRWLHPILVGVNAGKYAPEAKPEATQDETWDRPEPATPD